MTFTAVLLSPYTHVLRPVCVFCFQIVNNLVLIPVWYVLRIIVFTCIKIPLKPVNYVLMVEEDNYDWWALYRFCLHFSHFLAVSTIFGILVGYVLGKHLTLLSKIDFPTTKKANATLGVEPRVSDIRSTYVSHIKPDFRAFEEQASVYEDDDGYSYTRENTKIFDSYNDSTNLTTITEK